MNPNQRRRGAALLEFAAALPFSLVLFLGIGDFSVFFWRQTQMEEVARTTIARLNPSRAAYATADPDSLRRLSASLQSDLRRETGRPNMTLALTRGYACPLPSGGERPWTDQPLLCAGERTYLRIVNDDPVEPMLRPMRNFGFPASAFSRHALRLR